MGTILSTQFVNDPLQQWQQFLHLGTPLDVAGAVSEPIWLRWSIAFTNCEWKYCCRDSFAMFENEPDPVGPFMYCVSTISRFWDPLPTYLSMFFVLKIIKNCHFLNPPPIQVLMYVIYEWSLSNRRIDQPRSLVHKQLSILSHIGCLATCN